jgi:hypothetical protein
MRAPWVALVVGLLTLGVWSPAAPQVSPPPSPLPPLPPGAPAFPEPPASPVVPPPPAIPAPPGSPAVPPAPPSTAMPSPLHDGTVLTLESRPEGARVRIDGREVPVADVALDAALVIGFGVGRHSIELAIPGARPFRLMLDVSPGERGGYQVVPRP